MTRKLIALDLDGTTLDATGHLTARTIATLRAAQQAGHVVVIATGRPDSISEQFYDELGLTSPLINFNGALIHRPHQAWAGERQVTIPPATALALTDLKRQFAIKVMVAEGKQLLLADHGYTNIPFLPDLPQPTTLFDEAGLRQAPISVTMFIAERTLAPLQAAVRERFPKLTSQTWGAWQGEHTALEVTAPGSGKAQGLAYVAGQYGIAPADIIAFGDDQNDADMLAYAGTGVAMANAKPAIKQLADVVTSADNAHDGVARYLTAHGLAAQAM